MNVVPFDTLKLADRLEAGGFSAEQAKTAAGALAEAMTGAEPATKADLSNLATKADLSNFATKADLSNLATKADLSNFATKADLSNLATKAELAELKADLLKWMIGTVGVQTVVILGAVIALVRVVPG